MTKLYQFTLHHQSVNDDWTYDAAFRTYYTIEVDHEMLPSEISFYASVLASAEAYCYHSNIAITHVVALEVVVGEVFDERTITHTCLLNYTGTRDLGGDFVRGLRPGFGLDQWWGVSILRNKLVGGPGREYLPGVINPNDLNITYRHNRDPRRFVLNMDGTFRLLCFDYYCLMLEQLPGNDTLYNCDRYGNLSYEQENTDELRVIGRVSNNVLQRRHSPAPYSVRNWVHRLMMDSMRYMRLGLAGYFRGMTEFDGEWTKNHIPNLYGANMYMQFACGMWYWLADAINYGIPTEYEEAFFASTLFVPPPFDFPDVRLYIENVNDEPLRVIGTLMRCWKFFDERYGHLYTPIPRDTGALYIDETGAHLHPLVTKSLYEDFDNITGAIFKAADCINVLSQILHILNPVPRRTAEAKKRIPYLSNPRDRYDDEPQQYVYFNMLEVPPASRGGLDWTTATNIDTVKTLPYYPPAQPIRSPRPARPAPRPLPPAEATPSEWQLFFSEWKDQIYRGWDNWERYVGYTYLRWTDDYDFITPLDNEM